MVLSEAIDDVIEDLRETDALIKPNQWEDRVDGLPEMSLARNYGSGAQDEDDPTEDDPTLSPAQALT